MTSDELLLFLMGVVCVVVGWLIWKRQKISLINSYHYAKVKDKDKEDYTSWIGKGIVFIGWGIMLKIGIDTGAGVVLGWIAFAACFIAGVVMIIYAQRKYNV